MKLLISILILTLFISGCPENSSDQSLTKTNTQLTYNITPDQFIDRFTSTVTRLASKDAKMNWPTQPAELEEVSTQDVLVASYNLAPSVNLSGIFDKQSKKLINIVIILDGVKDPEQIMGAKAYLWLTMSSYDPEMTPESAAAILEEVLPPAAEKSGQPFSTVFNDNVYTATISQENKVTFVIGKAPIGQQ